MRSHAIGQRRIAAAQLGQECLAQGRMQGSAGLLAIQRRHLGDQIPEHGVLGRRQWRLPINVAPGGRRENVIELTPVASERRRNSLALGFGAQPDW